MTAPLPFDSIVLVEGSELRPLTIEQLDAMPMHVRVSAILEQRLRFFADGAIVDVGIALKALAAWRRTSFLARSE